MILIASGEEYKLWSSSLFSLFQPPVTLHLYGPNVTSASCSQTPITCVNVCLNVGNRVWHPHKTTRKIVALYRPVLISTFLDGSREDKRLWVAWQRSSKLICRCFLGECSFVFLPSFPGILILPHFLWICLYGLKSKGWICPCAKHHAVEMYGGGWGTAPRIFTSTLNAGEWSASHPGHFTPGERAPGNHWIGGWMGPGTGLDVPVGKKSRRP
jgi:hypothetical protein